MYIYTYTHMYIYTCIHLSIYTYMYIYIYTCIHTYTYMAAVVLKGKVTTSISNRRPCDGTKTTSRPVRPSALCDQGGSGQRCTKNSGLRSLLRGLLLLALRSIVLCLFSYAPNSSNQVVLERKRQLESQLFTVH